MPDRVRKVNYCYLTVPHRTGRGVEVLGELRDADVDLLGMTGFPAKRGKAQLDLVTERMAPIRRIARAKGWRVSKPKKGFLITGKDQTGAVHRHVRKLQDAGINITAANAVSAGKGRYGMMLWVKPKDYRLAARTLRAK
ncbi:MAG: hypothetical protein KAY32_10445 [Candidatus Eisenbacteria sp.]|nr:hypothetical protein [Candidatus Eisenbacteria bacterium]